MRFKLRFLCLPLLSFVFLLTQDCTPRKTIFINDVYTNPIILYSRYKKIAVLEFDQGIEVKELGIHEAFTELLEKELVKEGYDIVKSDKLDSFLQHGKK